MNCGGDPWSHLRVLEAASGGSRALMRAVMAGFRCILHGCDLLQEHRVLLQSYAMTSGSRWDGHVALSDAGFDQGDPTIALGDASRVLIDAVDEARRISDEDQERSRWDLMSRLSSSRVLRPINRGLASDGFHRVGCLDEAGRRSLWLREEGDAIEIVAGREGGDASLRVTRADPSFGALSDVMSCARFAAEWEDPSGGGLDRSYAMDRHPRSVHRTACSIPGDTISCAGCGRPFCAVCLLPADLDPKRIRLAPGDGVEWFCDDDACLDREVVATGDSTIAVAGRHTVRSGEHR
jgi:hypothetical protein